MTSCPNCGHQIPPGRRFCSQCGTPVQQQEKAGTLQEGMHRLGIPIGTRQIVGFVAAVIAGMVVARILPYVYDPIFGNLTSLLVGTSASTLRDTFNVLLMTATTCSTSFLIAFIAFRKSNGPR